MNYLVAGLGNIGAEYANTRHNIGFMVLDAWAQASDIVFATERYGDLCTVSFKGRKFYLLKPSTYMNLSGNAVRYWVQKLNIQPENLIVVCDDLNLPFGTLRMRLDGSNGGHNGLGNIEQQLGTRQYARIRVGIGKEFHPGEQIDYVLSDFTSEEKEMIPDLCKKVADGIRTFATAGPQMAMNLLNIRKKE